MTKLSKKAALRRARGLVGQVFQCVPGTRGYGFSVYVDSRTYRAAVALGDYNTARKYRSCAIYEIAAELICGRDDLGMPPLFDADHHRLSLREQFDAACKEKDQ